MSNVRAEMRRMSRQKEKDSKVRYNFTAEEVDKLVKERSGKMLEQIQIEALEDGIGAAMVLLLTIPMSILRDEYWPKSYKQKLPKFADQIIDMMNKWESGEVDLEQLREDIWNDAGIRIERDFIDKETERRKQKTCRTQLN